MHSMLQEAATVMEMAYMKTDKL
uniref:Uncharacterized protein n=1 Tax=Anguilla anguilla TaxID=7936 RepID=A0A0E9VNU9_ANGAN